jgi:hypothetical protein
MTASMPNYYKFNRTAFSSARFSELKVFPILVTD